MFSFVSSIFSENQTCFPHISILKKKYSLAIFKAYNQNGPDKLSMKNRIKIVNASPSRSKQVFWSDLDLLQVRRDINRYFGLFRTRLT